MRNIRTTSLLRRLLGSETGTGAMELGLAMPMLLLLLLGTIDASRMIAAKIDLEQAAQRTTDYALSLRPTSNDGTYLQAEAANAADVPTSDVTVDLFLECDGVRMSFSLFCFPGQTQARFVSVAIQKDVGTVFDWGALSAIVGSRALPSSVTLQGDSIVRLQ